MGAVAKHSKKTGIYFALSVVSGRSPAAVKALMRRNGWDPETEDGILSFVAHDSLGKWKRKP